MLLNIKPLITEKTIEMTKKNWYTFAVPQRFGKNDLVPLIEKTFSVNILKIKTVVVKGKSKRSVRSRKVRKLSNWKKAMVLLKEGQKIAVFDQA